MEATLVAQELLAQVLLQLAVDQLLILLHFLRLMELVEVAAAVEILAHQGQSAVARLVMSYPRVVAALAVLTHLTMLVMVGLEGRLEIIAEPMAGLEQVELL